MKSNGRSYPEKCEGMTFPFPAYTYESSALSKGQT